ncbi:MAG: YfiR/HmsC family protein [Anaeromyxobacteraceae bacterium]
MTLALPALALALAAGPAGETPVPPDARALLLLRVLGYDRTLADRCGDEVIVAVGWSAGDEDARDALVEALRSAAARFQVAGHRVRAVPLRLGPPEPAQRAREAHACVLVLAGPTPGDPAALGREAAAARLLTVADERAGVAQGLALGFVRVDGRARVLVNVAAARAAGAELDAALFTVAEAVGPPR